MAGGKHFIIKLCINGSECSVVEEYRSSKRARRIFDTIKLNIMEATMSGRLRIVIAMLAETLGISLDDIEYVDVHLVKVKDGVEHIVESLRFASIPVEGDDDGEEAVD